MKLLNKRFRIYTISSIISVNHLYISSLTFLNMVEKYVRYAIQERILKVLSKVDYADITEIARKSKTIALTARKHLERLKRDGVIEEQRKGSSRFFMLIRE